MRQLHYYEYAAVNMNTLYCYSLIINTFVNVIMLYNACIRKPYTHNIWKNNSISSTNKTRHNQHR